MNDMCNDCLYFDITRNKCKRYPPQVIDLNMLIYIWPSVHADDWCGEFVRKIHDVINSTI